MQDKVSGMIPELKTEGSNFDVGFEIGQSFQPEIRHLLEGYTYFQHTLRPFLQTMEGQAVLNDFLALHRERFPLYMQELEGISQGSQCPIQDIFAINLRGVFRQMLKQDKAGGCFDVALLTEQAAIIGHNEDADPSFYDAFYLVHAKLDEKTEFTAFCYPGFLPGNAFGFNQHGVFFSVDNIQPHKTQVGIGRHFIARSLLEAHSIQDAVDRAAVPDLASGFSFTIGSADERRIVIIESTPQGVRTHEVEGWFFHANHCVLFNEIEQTIAPSSRIRLRRAWDLLRTGALEGPQDVPAILGDNSDAAFPIYRQAVPPDKMTTMATVIADLDRREVRLYTGHPLQNEHAPMRFSFGK